MKRTYLLSAILLVAFCAVTHAQSVRFYKFNDITYGKREPYSTTRTLRTYPIGFIYREGATEPKLTFTPYNKKWYYLEDISHGDTIRCYVKRKNVYITEYRTGQLPAETVGRKFFGDGATARIIALNKAGHSVEGLESVRYVLEVNLGYYTSTYPIVKSGEGFTLDHVGETKLMVDDQLSNIVDRRGALKWNARCVDNDEQPVIYYLSDLKAIYYNGKVLHQQK